MSKHAIFRIEIAVRTQIQVARDRRLASRRFHCLLSDCNSYRPGLGCRGFRGLLKLVLSELVLLVGLLAPLQLKLIQLLVTLTLLIIHRTTHCYILRSPQLTLLPRLLEDSPIRPHLPPLPHSPHFHPQQSLHPAVRLKTLYQAQSIHSPHSPLHAYSPQPKAAPTALINW